MTQVSTIHSALDKVAVGRLDDHAKHCTVGSASDDRPGNSPMS